MAEIPYVFNDIGLTDPFDDASDVLGADALNGSFGTGVFYVGTATSGNKIGAASDAGVDPIVVSIVDAASGSGVEATHIKLATTSGGLSSATAGASLTIGTWISYGTPVAVHYRWDNSTGGADSTEISLSLVALSETTI